MTWTTDVFVDEEGTEWVRFAETKMLPEEPPPEPQTLAVTIRLTGALLQRQQTLGPLLAPAYVPPF